MKIGFIGTGNIAGAVVGGALASGTIGRDEALAYDIDAQKLSAFALAHGITAAESAQALVEACETVFIAVKPADIPALFASLDAALADKRPLIISTAAGTTLDALENMLSFKPALARIMPNINAAVGCSMTAFCGNDVISDEQLAFTERLCASFGKAVSLPEKSFSAYSAIAGCAPAFVYIFIDELARAGVKIGLNKKLATEIAVQTVFGSAAMVEKSGVHPYELADRVCSPGGTTIEGVAALRENGFESAVIKAVLASYEKDIKMQKK